MKARRPRYSPPPSAGSPRKELDEATATDEELFLDLPVLTKRDDGTLGDLCPKCKGHGSFNIALHAYGEGRHFRRGCGACWGYGYLARGQTCPHEWRDATFAETEAAGIRLYRCEHHWKCALCGQDRVVDSSD